MRTDILIKKKRCINMNKMKKVACMIMCFFLIASSSTILTAEENNPTPQTEIILISALPETQEVDLGDTFTISIYVDPQWEEIRGVSTDILHWDPGFMELVSIETGDLLPSEFVAEGFNNYTLLPGADIAIGETRVWDFPAMGTAVEFPYNLSEYHPELTKLRFAFTHPARELNITLKINDDHVVSEYIPAPGIPNDPLVKYYNLQNWTDAGANTSTPNLKISVTNHGTNVVPPPRVYIADGYKKSLLWSAAAGESTFMPGYFAHLTFKAIGMGTCNFYIAESMASFGATQYETSTTNCSVIITMGDAPVVSSPNPSHNAINVDKNLASLTATITDGDGDEMDWTIETYPDIGSSSGTRYNGQISHSLAGQIPLDFDTQYTWWVNVTDGWNPVSYEYKFTVRSEYNPTDPTGFDATTLSHQAIRLDWAKGTHADRTYIVAKQGGYPADRDDGDEIYNGIGTTFTHSGLDPLETWYYKAWSYNEDDETWSAGDATATETTLDNFPPILGTPTPANGTGNLDFAFTWSISITDGEGDLIDWEIECSNGQRNSGTNEAGGIKSLALSGLDIFTEYTVWVNATDAAGSGEWTLEWFTFTTKDNSPPEFGTPTPAHDSTIDTIISIDWSILIEDPEEDLFDWTIECSNGQSNSGLGDTDGIKTLTIDDLEFDTEYTVWVNATDVGSESWTNETFTFSTPSFDPPGSFNAVADGRFKIDIEWIRGDYADSVLILSKLGEYPSSVDDPDAEERYNGTAVGLSHINLNPSVTWYYRAWSWNETKGVYSEHAQAFATTDENLPPTVVIRPAEGTTGVSLTPRVEIDYEDPEGDRMLLVAIIAEKEEIEGEIYMGKTFWAAMIIDDEEGTHKFNWVGDMTEQEISEKINDTLNILNESGWAGLEYPYVCSASMEQSLEEDTEYAIFVMALDEYMLTDEEDFAVYIFNFTTGSIIETQFDLIYLNATIGTGTGYNYIPMLMPFGHASDVGELLISENVSWEAVLYYDPVTQSYQDGIVYDGNSMSGTNFPIYAGDVILIVVTESELDIDYGGFSPSMPWEDLPVYEGWNFLGRTGESVMASDLGEELDISGVNWSSIAYWDQYEQTWSTAYMEETGVVDFEITTGMAVLVRINEDKTFRMGGW